MRRLKNVLLILAAGMCLVLATGCKGPQKPKAKIEITKLDDLPKHTYPATAKPSEIVKSHEQIRDLAAKVRGDVTNDLDTYAISDATTLKRKYGALLTISLIDNDDDTAEELIDKIQNLEEKEAAKLMTGVTTLAMIDAKREVGPKADDATYRAAFKKHLAERTSRLPWDVVQDEIEQGKGMMEIYSENLLMGVIQAQMEPVVEKTGELDEGQAQSLLGMHFMMTERLPVKDEIISVYQDLIDSNRVEKPNIWKDRSVTLSESADLTPVLVAPWDSGVDDAIFHDVLWVNPDEQPDGKDDDGNGFVDDINGVAYDMHAQRTSGTLVPLGDAAKRIDRVMKHMKGFMDIQAAVDSPEAAELKKMLSEMSQEDIKGFLEDLSLAGNYSHGTHVAGIMVQGNPFARVLIARHTYDYHIVPVARTLEWGERDGAKCRDTVAYFKDHGVRVVNMSWGEAMQDAEDSLEANGIGENAEERREIARKVFAMQREGLYEAIKNAPDVLFVCAAGNSDNDVEFDEYIPSSFDLPNLITVGAVDQAGEPTGFTSFGRTVEVYANGFEVESYVPGGSRMKMSGTSMASPQVANLAAKLIAIDPGLKPAEVIELIEKGADQRTDGEAEYLLLNPKKSVEMLRARKTT